MNYQENLEITLETFDFEEVYKVMRILGWKWYNKNTKKSYTPSINKLKETAIDLLEQVAQSISDEIDGSGFFQDTVFPREKIHWGGFVAEGWTEDGEEIHFNLSFEIWSSTSDLEDDLSYDEEVNEEKSFLEENQKTYLEDEES